MTDLAKLIAQMAVAARNGEPAGLLQIKQTLQKDPSRADPHVFSVNAQHLVEDSLRTGPMIRKDVYPAISEFVSPFSKHSIGVDVRHVISVVGRYPSLVDRFAIKGYSEIDRLEASLVTDEGLEPSSRARVLKRIQRLNSGGAPVWQNWINQMAQSTGHIFDGIVREWLNESIDWKEKSYFDATKVNRRFGVESAREFFEILQSEHLYYFGLKLSDGFIEGTGESFKCVFLRDSIKAANDRAAALGVKFRFERSVR